jgi:hypothetical protein
MKTVLKIGVLILCVLFSKNGFSQKLLPGGGGDGGTSIEHTATTSYSIGMPSPTAASLGKFGNSSVSYSTGTPSIGIPLYNIQHGDINVPINLQYHASGVRITEIPSWVGLGWALNAGGVISRTMRGLPDESTNGFQNIGWMAANYSGSGSTISNGVDSVNKQTFLRNVTLGQWDSEPDEYTLTLPGLSAKFIIDHNGEIILLPHKSIKIEVYNSDNWIVTNENGTKYYFEEKETTYTATLNRSGSSFGGILPQTYVSSWYLTKIESSSGDFEINFTYESSPSTTDRTINISTTRTNNLFGPSNCNVSENDVVVQNTNKTYNKYLKTITTPTNRIEFLRDEQGNSPMRTRLRRITVSPISSPSDTLLKFALDYSNIGSPTRHVLSSVQEFGANGNSKGPFEMEYFTSYTLPGYNSLAIDYWGYYNGKTNNNTLVPAVYTSQFGNLSGADRDPSFNHMKTGTLNKLTYPTGGFAEYTYEANQYYDYLSNSNKTGGGVRIKQIKIHDGIQQSNDIIKTYTYNHPTISGRSSGYLTAGPLEPYQYFPTNVNNECPYVIRKSTAEGVIGGTAVAYNWVREYIGTVNNNNGYSLVKSQFYQHSGRDSGAWKRGKVLERHENTSSGNMVYKTINTYDFTAYHVKSVDGVEASVDWVGLTDTTYTAKVFDYSSYVSQLIEKEHQTYDSNGINYFSTFEEFMFDSLDTVAKISPLRSVKHTNSNGDIRITEYEYAFEQEVGMKLLNMLTQPYSVTVKDGSDVLSKQWTLWDQFNGNWHPCEVWVWNGDSVTPPDNCTSN